MSNISYVDVLICVAVSDCGNVLISLPDECNVQRRNKHQQWLDALKTDSRLWVVKTVKTSVPLPVQYEELAIEPVDASKEGKT